MVKQHQKNEVNAFWNKALTSFKGGKYKSRFRGSLSRFLRNIPSLIFLSIKTFQSRITEGTEAAINALILPSNIREH